MASCGRRSVVKAVAGLRRSANGVHHKHTAEEVSTLGNSTTVSSLSSSASSGAFPPAVSARRFATALSARHGGGASSAVPRAPLAPVRPLSAGISSSLVPAFSSSTAFPAVAPRAAASNRPAFGRCMTTASWRVQSSRDGDSGAAAAAGGAAPSADGDEERKESEDKEASEEDKRGEEDDDQDEEHEEEAEEAEEEEEEVEEAPKGPSRFSKFMETTRSVMAGVFGIKTHKPVEEREWDEGKVPVEINTEDTAVMVVEQKRTRWEKMAHQLQQTPLMQAFMQMKATVAESEIGDAARAVKGRVGDVKEDLAEKWETSQHPLVYNASAAYDGMFAETEWAQAVREIRRMDPAFDMPTFLEEMKDVIIPDVVHGFLVGSRKDLAKWCKETAMAQIGAVLRAREAEQLTLDPTILSISNVDIAAAKVMPRGPPVLVVSSMVQQINCMTNAKGEVVEGNEDEIRAVFYVFAMMREYDEATASLHWRVSELSMVGSQLYL